MSFELNEYRLCRTYHLGPYCTGGCGIRLTDAERTSNVCGKCRQKRLDETELRGVNQGRDAGNMAGSELGVFFGMLLLALGGACYLAAVTYVNLKGR